MVSEEETDPEDPCEELSETDMAEIQEDRFEDEMKLAGSQAQ